VPGFQRAFVTTSAGEGRPIGVPTTSFQVDSETHAVAVFAGPLPGNVRFTFLYAGRVLMEDTHAQSSVAPPAPGGTSTVTTRFINGPTATPRPWWAGSRYRIDVDVDGRVVARLPLTVLRPADAIPSRVDEVRTGVGIAQDANGDYQIGQRTNLFQPMQPVSLLAEGAFGRGSLLFGRVLFPSGQEVPGAPRLISTAPENITSGSCTGTYDPPPGGWPPGTYQLEVSMEERVVGHYPVTVTAP
jgi:hypothetical protein